MRSRSFEARLAKVERTQERAQAEQARSPFPTWFVREVSDVDKSQLELLTDWQYRALPAQQQFHADLTTRFKGYSGPVGSGKSHALAYEAIFLSRLNPGLLGLMGAPTYAMLRDSTQRIFFEVLNQEGIDYNFHRQENKLTFLSNRSEIIFRTMENPDRLRGPNLAWFALDELTYTHEDAWTRLLGRIRHPLAKRLCGCAVWTPKGFDWVHRRFIENLNPDYSVVRATPRENIHLPEDFYERLKGSYSEAFFKQEALGEYVDLIGGRAYYAFSQENIRDVKYNPDFPVCWALDFNVDPLCSVILQIIETSDEKTMFTGRPARTVHVLGEMVLPNSNTEEATQAFLNYIHDQVPAHMPRAKKFVVYGDANGHSRTTKASRTDYEIIRQVFKHHETYDQLKVTMRENTANPIVKDRVNATNAAFCNAEGKRRVFINPRCEHLITDLREVRWKRDANNNPLGELDKSDSDRTHLSDALSYCIAREFNLKSPIGYKRGLCTIEY